MTDRAAGQKTWSLSPTDIYVSYGSSGQGADWFGPLEPMTPLAPPQTIGRQWDYPAGYNLSTLARPYGAISFNALRGLADSYDLLRLVIETRKDQVARLNWSVKKRNKAAATELDQVRIDSVTRFLRRPDGQHNFSDWLRLILEDLFVIDAPAIYMQRDRSGRLTALLPLDGATIKPIIDDWGRTPQPYADHGELIYPAAYQQILKGYPAIDYTVSDMLYRPRNIRTNRVYGFAPVEQIVTTVNIALRRQIFLLDYFTEGNIPDSLIGVPDNWTPDQISTYQKYWDTYFDGDLGRRRKAKFVPGGVAKTFVQTKEPSLTGPFDEWLARIICFAFSISPQGLVAQVNRATAETQKKLSEEEGLQPILGWAKSLIDDVMTDEFDSSDLEFVWEFDPELDAATQETILSGYTSKGILTINEARAMLGHAPLNEPAADRAMALTGAGYVALGQSGQAPAHDASSND
jgi:hypothetical protein